VIDQPVSMVSQCDAGAWLNGLASGDQRWREAVVHQRRVLDDALYKSTITYLSGSLLGRFLCSKSMSSRLFFGKCFQRV